jgi:hypothetical protein
VEVTPKETSELAYCMKKVPQLIKAVNNLLDMVLDLQQQINDLKVEGAEE